jgi:hypothetical protein
MLTKLAVDTKFIKFAVDTKLIREAEEIYPTVPRPTTVEVS